MKKLSRAERNNNPLNIIKTSTINWVGQKREGCKDSHFAEFLTPYFGWRAAFKQLGVYYSKHQLFTVEKIIMRWAPPTENDTEAYIRKVCETLKLDRREPLGSPQAAPLRWYALGLAMCRVEAGEVLWPLDACTAFNDVFLSTP